VNVANQGRERTPFVRAAGLMLASTLCFGLMAVVIRVVSSRVGTAEIAFFRNLFGLLALLPLLWRGAPGVFRTRQLPRYFVRSAIGIGSMLCGFWAIGHLPMAQAISLSYSTPLFVTIFAAIWLGEVVRRRRWSAVLLGFAGVLVIVRPGTTGFSAGALVAVAAAVLSSVVAIQIKQLSRVDPPDTNVFWTNGFMVPHSHLPAMFQWQWPQGSAWPWLMAIGVLGTGGQLLWTRALKLGEVSALTPIGFMQLPLVSVLAWLLFGERLDRWTVLGAAIILAANAYIAQREARLSKRRASIAASEAAEPGT
jgi:drug/metabolite transporter (DMT)-like permease